MPQPPGYQGWCHLSSDEALALGKEGRGPAFHPLPTQILHTPIHLGRPGRQQRLVHWTLNDHIWLYVLCLLEMWVVVCAGMVSISLTMGKMSGFVHEWEKGDSRQGHKLLSEPPHAPPRAGKWEASSVLGLTLTSLKATVPSHQLSPPSLF